MIPFVVILSIFGWEPIMIIYKIKMEKEGKQDLWERLRNQPQFVLEKRRE